MANIGNLVTLFVGDIDAVMVDFDRLRLYRATSQDGTYSLLTTITLVADQAAYSHQDTTGVLTDFYTFSYFNSSSLNESQQSEPIAAGGQPLYTRLTLRRLVVDELGLYGKPNTERVFPGVSGVTTTNGSNTTLICSEYADTTFVNESFLGQYVNTLDGAAADQVRRVSAYTNSNGAFAVQPAFTTAINSAVNFDIYGEEPPRFWNDRLNEAIKDVPIQLRFPIAGISNQREYALPDFVFASYQIFGLEAQHGETLREHTFLPGVHFEVIEREGGGLSLYFPNGLPANRVYYVLGRRYPTELTDDDQTILLDDQRLRLLVTTAAQKAATRLLMSYGGSDDHSRWKAIADLLERRRRGLVKELRPWPKTANPRQGVWMTTGGERRRPYPLGY